jgi:hypothetical protein
VSEEKWRTVFTDTESESGVAPICPEQRTLVGQHDPDDHDGGWRFNEAFVYDCCPGPHIQCWTPHVAVRLRDFLNEYSIEVCD